ncbi:MAG TPA: D-tyrosyl-tRNA(Tyr) deacylase [Bacteroidales bacterium]|nr:MAG: D-tyrosyl-tRNA(Tyr) deacylase [Bacteroidetes bacterium GWF2_33_38]OFY72698.1 MAG: D-tyrosyl-tRNA(Tyr) deacylase [Bacteroidetes bacterium RIFOXYA12_FULL_33_9]OFY85920.1 MAG: D-tyrosyl-tRNA(Tyr) deacylase [Bacteroidetes bacterium RIFOXYA2_FULL_33_7]HBF88844.1 D-tyrosyl-tRNA(Tyr) deacylase [Bacteroidales bacterium]
MRVVVQRVKTASVFIDKVEISRIEKGLLILLGIEKDDAFSDIEYLVKKIVNLRIFNDENGIMNISIKEINGELLVVSQFTLHASTKKGNRPSYIKAELTEKAIPLYEAFINQLQIESGIKPLTGRFGAMMDVSLVNDGPVTIIIDSRTKE